MMTSRETTQEFERSENLDDHDEAKFGESIPILDSTTNNVNQKEKVGICI